MVAGFSNNKDLTANKYMKKTKDYFWKKFL